MAEEESAAADVVGDDGLEHAGGEQTPNVDPAGATSDDTTLHKSALMRYDFDNRELYWDLVLPLLNPAPPQLHNTGRRSGPLSAVSRTRAQHKRHDSRLT